MLFWYDANEQCCWTAGPTFYKSERRVSLGEIVRVVEWFSDRPDGGGIEARKGEVDQAKLR